MKIVDLMKKFMKSLPRVEDRMSQTGRIQLQNRAAMNKALREFTIWRDPRVELPEDEQYILIRVEERFYSVVIASVYTFVGMNGTLDPCDEGEEDKYAYMSITNQIITGWTPLPDPGD